ncbi:phage protein NinX family protein [Klebsiella pneumoniae]|nr:phage protein NinX family protein [Klebsiella pneumoniae]
MDYSKLSDFEINLRVAEIVVDYDCISRLPYTDMAVHWGDGANWHVFNPCNNPADAWPIIHEHGISIAFDSYEDEWVAWGEFSFDQSGWDMRKEPEISYAHTNPLYAAMIVFLKMQDSRK